MKNENKRTKYIARAVARGSTAQTFAGAKKYLMSNWRQPRECGWIALLAERAASAQENAAKTAEHVMQCVYSDMAAAQVADANKIQEIEEIRQTGVLTPGVQPSCEVDGGTLPPLYFFATPAANNLRTLEPVVRGVYDGPHTYRVTEAARRANPDAKRAKNDKVFSAKFLKKINRQIAALINVKIGTLAEITAAADSRGVRAAKIEALVGQKSIAVGRKLVAPILQKNSDLPGIKIGGFSADFARKHGATGINMSGKDATIEATCRTSYGHHSAGETTWRNGKPVNYSRATHDNFVRSFALIRAEDPRTVDFAFHVTEVSVTLPGGCRWDVDANGLRAMCGPDDYHPTAPELLAKNCAETIVGKIRKNAEIRAKIAAEKLAEAADMEGVYVCIADSLRAGNCLSGTQNFAARHNIDCRRHYPALEILRQANGDESRVRLAIRAAISRTREENERGYANLAEHKIG